jgi:hypothetical protein
VADLGRGVVTRYSRESDYRVGKLLEDKADKLRKDKRLLILGYENFRVEHAKDHVLMDEPKVAHDYRDGPARKHDWHSGWVEEAVELLLGGQ